jgi:hypothetical protein
MPLRRFIPYGDPVKAGRHPYQTFILALCVASGLPLLVGHPASGSLESLLPLWLSITWGASLFVGALLGLSGPYWRGTAVTALTIERCGLMLVGGAACIYGAIIVGAVGFAGSFAAAITVGFGGASLLRAHQLGRLVRYGLRAHGGV